MRKRIHHGETLQHCTVRHKTRILVTAVIRQTIHSVQVNIQGATRKELSGKHSFF